jgi:hypothetical protein
MVDSPRISYAESSISMTQTLGIAAVRQALALDAQLNWFAIQWDRAAEQFDPAGQWLPTPEKVAEYCQWMEMAEEPARYLLQGARELRNNPALVMLAWQYHWAMFMPQAVRPDPGTPWFPLPESLGLAGRMFQAVVILSGIPRYRSEHQRRGIPEAISKANLAGIELWMRSYLTRFGQWGFDRGSWLSNHLCDRLVRMDRLEFGMSRFNFGFTILKARSGDHRVLALADTGMRLRSDGRFHDAAGTAMDDPGWGTYQRITDQAISGYPVIAPNVVAR